jgi:uncharacterized protein YecE (DUF72 family)
MIRIGTSGFSYADWVGPVYPEGLPDREQLAYYAREFSTVELNVTFYRVPEVRLSAGWVKRTPPDFQFSVKAFQGITHQREDSTFAAFTDALKPMIEAGKLGCILAQFPNSFRPTTESRDYLRRLRDGFAELSVVVEFRNSAWVKPATFDLLSELGLGFCCVDEPSLPGLMPQVVVATSAPGYVRFHGRNAARWYNHKEAWERYDYTYALPELMEWAPRIRQLEALTPLTLVYFNNHFQGQAVRGARDLGQLLLGLE